MTSMFTKVPKDRDSMIDDIITIAENKGLLKDSKFRNILEVKTVKGRTSWGGRYFKKGKAIPYIGIAEWETKNNAWETVNAPWVSRWKQHLSQFIYTPLRGKKAQYAKVIKQLESGKVAWTEYNRICNDPDIGDWFGDPKVHTGAPLAMLLCHEIAHAIDFFLKEPGYGDHGPTWQRIYRILRKEYLSSTLNYQVLSYSFPLPEKVKQIPHQVKTFVQEGLFNTPQTQLQLI